MLLSGRISIGEMSFSPTRQFSLVELWSSSRVSYWGPPIWWTLRGNTSQVGALEVAYWAWMSYDCAGTLERIHGRFMVYTYEQILTNVMIPSAWELYLEGTLHFQQDNHPVHTTDRIQEWFNRRPDIDLLEWPPNSPEWIRLKMCGLEWKGSYALIGQNQPFEHQTNYETEY